MKEIVKQIKEHPLYVILILFGVPTVVYMLSVIPACPAGANNDWAGFWGGYIGAIIGGIITWIGVDKTIKHENYIREQDAIKAIKPVLCSDFSMHTYDEILKCSKRRGMIIEVFAERAGNGDSLDKTSIMKYKDIDEEKIRFVQYKVVNLSNYAASNISIFLNDVKVSAKKFTILSKSEIYIIFIVHLKSARNGERVKFELDFFFEDELGKKKYRQHDEMQFYKDEEGRISNESSIIAMTCPEEI